MALVAKTEPNVTIRHPHGGEDHVFVFGDDGARNVSQAEAEVLADYERSGGPFRIQISESTKRRSN